MICMRCHLEKDVSLFRPVGFECKKCESERKARERVSRREKDPTYREKERERERVRRSTPEHRRKRNALKQQPKHKERFKARLRERYATEPGYREMVLARNTRNRRKDPCYKEKKRKEYGKYKDKYLARQRKRYAEDPHFRIRQNLTNRINGALKGKTMKAETSMKLIGCTIQELKIHLESKFREGMAWENQGITGWHIDHVVPCNDFSLSDPEEQKRCFHYTNLQPLWWHENLKKGIGKAA